MKLLIFEIIALKSQSFHLKVVVACLNSLRSQFLKTQRIHNFSKSKLEMSNVDSQNVLLRSQKSKIAGLQIDFGFKNRNYLFKTRDFSFLEICTLKNRNFAFKKGKNKVSYIYYQNFVVKYRNFAFKNRNFI